MLFPVLSTRGPGTGFTPILVIVLIWIGTCQSCPEDCECSYRPEYFANCSKRNLYRVPFIVENVDSVCLAYNQIKIIGARDFEEAYNVRTLTLKNNAIYFIDENSFRSMIQLRELDLSSNAIYYINENVFRSLIELRELDLSNNNKLHIWPYTFINNINLQSLKFSGTRLLLSGPIINSTSLTFLDISYCSIEYLPHDALNYIPNLNTLYTHGNSFKHSFIKMTGPINKLKPVTLGTKEPNTYVILYLQTKKLYDNPYDVESNCVFERNYKTFTISYDYLDSDIISDGYDTTTTYYDGYNDTTNTYYDGYNDTTTIYYDFDNTFGDVLSYLLTAFGIVICVYIGSIIYLFIKARRLKQRNEELSAVVVKTITPSNFSSNEKTPWYKMLLQSLRTPLVCKENKDSDRGQLSGSELPNPITQFFNGSSETDKSEVPGNELPNPIARSCSNPTESDRIQLSGNELPNSITQSNNNTTELDRSETPRNELPNYSTTQIFNKPIESDQIRSQSSVTFLQNQAEVSGNESPNRSHSPIVILRY